MHVGPRGDSGLRRPAAVALVVLTLSIAGTAWAIDGVSGLLYALLFLAACTPGLPLGFALFGRGHAGGWLAGLLLGYAATSFAWWVVVFAGGPSPAAYAVAWAAAALATWGLTREVKTPLAALPRWTRRDTVALSLVLLMAPALVARPFTRLGSLDDRGNRQYRAYFIADYFWHTAVTAELVKQQHVPRDPFMASEPLHYYWTYFRVPATIAAMTGIGVQDALKLNAVGAGILFLGAIYFVAWCSLPDWPYAAAIAVALTVIAPSAEGVAAIVDLARRGQPLSELRNLNIDAVASWAFKGVRIDDLPRALWYTPHHACSCALGLLALPVAIGAGSRVRPGAALVAGCALGASVAFNPLVGTMFCGIYGVAVACELVADGASLHDVPAHVPVLVPVAASFAWCTLSRIGQGAGMSWLRFGFWGPATHATALTFLLQLGPLLVPMAIGLWPTRAVPFRWIRPAAAGVIAAVLLMHLVTLTSDVFWIGFRAGQIFFVTAPAIAGRGLVSLWAANRRGLAVALVLAVLAVGAPTTAIDAYNVQDVDNRGFAPRNEFHWTVLISADELAALDWIRTHTPADAVVQMEPMIRGRETWTLVPTFAERRMAAGMALALIPLPGASARNQRVQRIYSSDDAATAWREAMTLGIDFLYVGAAERGAYPAVAKFDTNPRWFTPVYRNEGAIVYAVRRVSG